MHRKGSPPGTFQVAKATDGSPKLTMPCKTDSPLSIAMIGTRGLPATDGGVEMSVEGLSRELVKRGHSVTVYGRRGYCDPAVGVSGGMRQISLGQINTKHLEAISHTALATGHAVFRGNYDVVHFHATGPSLLSWLPQLGGTPTVATIQGMDWRREKWGTLARLVLRLAARVASTVPNETIVVSRVLQRILMERYGRASNYIPNGVDLKSTTLSKPIAGLGDRPFALFLGRLVPEKQVHLLIDAFSYVEGDFQLAIAGSSSHSDDYVAAISRLAAEDDRVTLLGSRYGAEKAWLLRNATVFVQPSTIEGLPIALLEALACGRLTIVSDIPENVEAITVKDDLPQGLVFRTGDSKDLTRKLGQALLPDSRLPADGSLVGQMVRERYDWERLAEQTEAVYRHALA
jgi:glycosyltransferase involved in cell wall biosynthesis